MSLIHNPYLGAVLLFAGNFAPRGWAFCEGQILPISSNQSLYALLGTIYGGDGRTSFALPDLRGRVPVGSNGTFGNIGVRSGQSGVALTQAEMPPHTHAGTSTLEASLAATSSNANQASPGPDRVLARGFSAAAGGEIDSYHAAEGDAVVGGVRVAVGSSGGGQEHDNHQPSLGMNYIIALTGIFPSRS